MSSGGHRDHFVGGPLQMRRAKLAALLSLPHRVVLAGGGGGGGVTAVARYEDVAADQLGSVCAIGAAFGLRPKADGRWFEYMVDFVGPSHEAAAFAAAKAGWWWPFGPVWLGQRRRRLLDRGSPAGVGRLAAVCAGLDWVLEAAAGYPRAASECGRLIEHVEEQEPRPWDCAAKEGEGEDDEDDDDDNELRRRAAATAGEKDPR